MQAVGCLGPHGSFSEEAIQAFLTKSPEFNVAESEILVYSTIPQLLKACERREVAWAFVPVENSIEGQVGATLDTLIQAEDLLIYREYNYLIKQCLLTPRPMAPSEVERVYSHEQALGQCRDFLQTRLAHVQQMACSSTAEAAKIVAAAQQNWAAIAPRRAAQLYNLHCQDECIQDTAHNETRFILVGHSLAEMTEQDKTSLSVLIGDRPGALYNVLREFAMRGINLTHIESRPAKQRLGEYIFLIDLEGYVLSDPVQAALAALKKQQVTVKILGSYPRANC